ncbi:MAG TPA: CCA tRNA nucleotidyltransferase [Rhabdochlamydiaceae bacterium]|jgi:poly(A) polymerase|nr:CCA tRNA nucleotidyltransferase [Rhabdochlamydiaceae bacterium]
MDSRQIGASIVKKLHEAGFIAYFAGGWVRDFILQKPSDDIDIASSATVEEVQRLFPKTIPVGVAFGIVIVVQDGHQFEIASFRKDRGYIDGRRPTGIDPASPEEDAQRRDFTINGMFYDPIQDKIFDFVDGMKDLKKGIIRAIGDPKARFTEDRLRMMRAVRYSTRFNFPIESDTLQAILAQAETLLPSVAMERIWQEFKKMSQFSHFDTGLLTLHQLKLLPTIFPQLKPVSTEEIQKRVSCIEHFPKNCPTIAELLELFPNSSLQDLLNLCDYLKLSNADKEFVEFYSHAQRLLMLPDKWKEKLEPLEWARFYANSHSPLVLEIIAAHFSKADKENFLHNHLLHQQLLQQAILRIRTQSPIVRAEHLMAEGVAPGKKMGQLLQEAERISVNQGIEDRTTIIGLLKKSSLWK